MSTVTFGLNISLDGYCDHTIGVPSEELMDYFTDMMNNVDLFFFGRVMYQLMFPYWSDVAKDQSGSPAENRFAQRFTDMNKLVVSSTLNEVDENTRIIRSNPAEKLRKLKQQSGKKISVDSVSLLPELIHLIDEFNLVVHPTLVGKGRRLLDTNILPEQLNLKLVSTRIFQSGCVALHYVKQ
jgi:dihydrofolate reductase